MAKATCRRPETTVRFVSHLRGYICSFQPRRVPPIERQRLTPSMLRCHCPSCACNARKREVTRRGTHPASKDSVVHDGANALCKMCVLSACPLSAT